MFKTDSTRIPSVALKWCVASTPFHSQVSGGSSLVCGPLDWAALMFKTDSTRIPSSVALRCG